MRELSEKDKVEAITTAHVFNDSLKTWPEEKVNLVVVTWAKILKGGEE